MSRDGQDIINIMGWIMRKRFLVSVLLVLVLAVSFTACSNIEFKINFVVDDNVYASVQTNGGETIKMPVDPQKTGYEFDGWFWDNNTWQRPFTAYSLINEPLSENLLVYAKWRTAGELTGTQASFAGFIETVDGYYMTVPNSTKTFSFTTAVRVSSRASWTLSSDIEGNNTIASKTVALEPGDNTYYVLVKANDSTIKLYTLKIRRKPVYTVRFDANGGTSVDAQYIEEGGFATAPVTSRKGNTFTGWDYDFTSPVNGDIIVTASWAKATYVITLDANGGTVEETQIEVGYGEFYELPEPVKKGYNFGSWIYNGNFISTRGYWSKESGGTLVASWRIIEYYIVCDLDEGTLIESNPYSYNVNDPDIILNNPERPGYEFDGWSGTGLSGKVKTVNIPAGSTGHRFFSANWSAASYEVTLDDGAGGTTSVIAQYGKAMPAAPMPAAREGLIFKGYIDADGKCYYNANMQSEKKWDKTAAATLFARWLTPSEARSEYIIEAEETNLSGKTGYGLSGTVYESGMILSDRTGTASNGRYVGFLYSENISLEFRFFSGAEVGDAEIVLRLAADFEDIDLSPGNFKILLNGVIIEYSPLSIAYPYENFSDETSEFSDFTVAVNANLHAGANLVQIIVANTKVTPAGTAYATAPLVDCLKIYTAATLTWTSIFEQESIVL